MDPERTFLRVHARATGMLSQLLTPRIRLTMEYVYLAIAVALFCLLVVMHTNFVQQPGCSEELAGIEFTEAQLVQIKIISAGLWTQNLDDKAVVGVHKQGSTTENSKLPDANGEKMTTLTSRLWSYWISSGERSKQIFKPWKNDKEVIEPQTENVVDSSIMEVVSNEAEAQVQKGLHPSIPISPKESSWAAIISFIHNWWIYLSSFWKDAEQFTINNSQLWFIGNGLTKEANLSRQLIYIPLKRDFLCCLNQQDLGTIYALPILQFLPRIPALATGLHNGAEKSHAGGNGCWLEPW